MLSYIKLVTGEELLAERKISMDMKHLHLTNPCSIRHMFDHSGGRVVLVPWTTIVELNRNEFIINLRQIVTFIDVENDSIKSQYKEAIIKINQYIQQPPTAEESEDEDELEEKDELTSNTSLMIQPTSKKGNSLN